MPPSHLGTRLLAPSNRPLQLAQHTSTGPLPPASLSKQCSLLLAELDSLEALALQLPLVTVHLNSPCVASAGSHTAWLLLLLWAHVHSLRGLALPRPCDQGQSLLSLHSTKYQH